jgi:hypothetical protein
MVYTLKVDWTQQRIKAVLWALRGSSDPLVRRALADLRLHACDDAGADEAMTLKFSWRQETVSALLAALAAALPLLEPDAPGAGDSREPGCRERVPRARDHVQAALLEISSYREAVSEVIADNERRGRAYLREDGTWWEPSCGPGLPCRGLARAPVTRVPRVARQVFPGCRRPARTAKACRADWFPGAGRASLPVPDRLS